MPAFSAEWRRHLSETQQRAWAEGRKTAPGNKPTGIEQRLFVFLKSAGFEGVRRQEPFGRYRVDFYLPSHHLAFEADGVAWHERHPFRDQLEHDRKRDARLLRDFGLPVVRISEAEILAMSV